MNVSSGSPTASKRPHWLIPVGFLTYFIVFLLVASHASGFGPGWAVIAATVMGVGMPFVVALGAISSIAIFCKIVFDRRSMSVSYLGIALWLAVLFVCLGGVAIAIWR